jgi:hypothetical protein
MSDKALNVRSLASHFLASRSPDRPILLRPILLAPALLALTLSLASTAHASALQGFSAHADDSFLLESGTSFTTDLRDLDFPAPATYVSPVEISFADAQNPANLQAGAGDTPFLIEAFLGNQHFDSSVDGFGASPSYYGFYDDSLNAIQIRSMGTGAGRSLLLDNIEMTTLGSTVPEPNTLLLLSSAMLVLGVGLRCLFARD